MENISDRFRFKQFGIYQKKSAMKVGTDSVLLGCFAGNGKEDHILDIGTGTGILALMMAQKTNALVDAVEIDEATYKEARENFHNSDWIEQLNSFHSSIQDFECIENDYDLIITNPPYFKTENNFAIQNEVRAKARQDEYLSFDVLCEEVKNRLCDEGYFWTILPKNEAAEFIIIAEKYQLFLFKQIQIKPKPSKDYNRLVMCFVKHKCDTQHEVFTIYEDNGNPTEEYYQLTKDFLLWEGRVV